MKGKADKKTDQETVEEFMTALVHPLKTEIEIVRSIIKANPNISERIKWNAPSYYYKEDLLTFNPRMQNKVHLVFHHKNIVKIKSALLEGDYKDRRMVYFQNQQEIETHRQELQRIISELVQQLDQS